MISAATMPRRKTLAEQVADYDAPSYDDGSDDAGLQPGLTADDVEAARQAFLAGGALAAVPQTGNRLLGDMAANTADQVAPLPDLPRPIQPAMPRRKTLAEEIEDWQNQPATTAADLTPDQPLPLPVQPPMSQSNAPSLWDEIQASQADTADQLPGPAGLPGPSTDNRLLDDMGNDRGLPAPQPPIIPDTLGGIPEAPELGPDLAPPSVTSAATDAMNTEPPPPSYLQTLQARMDAMNQPPTLKNRLWRAIATLAPVGLAAAVGGPGAAAGAAAGANQGLGEQIQLGEQRRKTLQQQIEEEANREERMSVAQLEATERAKAQAAQNAIEQERNRIEELGVTGRNTASQMNAATAAQRVQFYGEKIGDADQLGLARLREDVWRDTSLDEYRRSALLANIDQRNDALAARERIAAGAQAGSTNRTQMNIEARAASTQRVQDAITARQVQRGYNGQAALKTTQQALAIAQKLPGYQNLSEEDQVSTLNALIDSGLGNQAPVISTQPGKPSGVLQDIGATTPGRGLKVTAGATRPAPQAAAAAQAPAQKTATIADLQAYAVANKVTFEQARQAAIAAGYIIKGQ